MVLQVGDQLLGADPGLGQLGEGQHHADADRVGVGVEEAAAGDAPGAPEHLDVDTLVALHPEALVDHLGGEARAPL